jgi:hypothetical protein
MRPRPGTVRVLGGVCARVFAVLRTCSKTHVAVGVVLQALIVSPPSNLGALASGQRPVATSMTASGQAVRIGTGTDRLSASNRALLDRIWMRVGDAQRHPGSACGTIVETRTSPMLTRPLIARGTFCVAGTDRFKLEYVPPTPVRLVFNRGILNVSADGGAHTEAIDVAAAVSRTGLPD